MKVTIEGKEIDLELTDEQKVVVERALKSNTGWERVKLKEYFYILENDVEPTDDGSTQYDNKNYNDANYFNNEELINNIIRAQTLQRKLWRRSAELCEKVVWSRLWCISYNYNEDENENDFLISSYRFSGYGYYIDFGQVYFDTEEHARQALEEFRDELTWYFTEFKSRMD